MEVIAGVIAMWVISSFAAGGVVAWASLRRRQRPAVGRRCEGEGRHGGTSSHVQR
jgi:hypothetical protein